MSTGTHIETALGYAESVQKVIQAMRESDQALEAAEEEEHEQQRVS